jgi:putative membrane protein
MTEPGTPSASPGPGGAMPPVYAAPRDWARMHPVSPVLKAWPAVVGVGAWWFYTGGPSWLGGGGDSEDIPSSFRLSLWALIGLAVLAAVVTVAFSFVSWRMNRFRITDDALEQHKGVLFRQQRHARLDRLQAVDVVQPLVARIFGFAKVSIEVAGGEDSSVSLEFLRLGDAEALRNEIVALAAGRRVTRARAASAAEPSLSRSDINPLSQSVLTEVPADAERELYAVPLPRLLMSLLRSWGAVWAAALVPVAIAVAVAAAQNTSFRQALLSVVGGSVAGLVGALTGVGAYVFAMLNRGFNFRAAIADDGIRLRHGLLETRRQTVPPGRVQAVRLQQSLLWRSKDWWHVSINVAGYQKDQDAVSTLLPVGPRHEAILALRLVLPHVALALTSESGPGRDDEELTSVLDLAMAGTGEEGGFVASPPAARRLDPWQWRQRGVTATETALVIRRGLFVREIFVVPHERTQSLSLAQGPIQRALGLASIEVQSTAGPVKPVAHHLAVADAVSLLDEQATRARERRKVQTPEQWAKAVEDLRVAAPAGESIG